MALIRNPDALRLFPDDPIPSFLGNKVFPGQGIALNRKTDKGFGSQVVISAINGAQGSCGEVFQMSESGRVPNNASLVLIDASLNHVVVTMPHPAEVLNWIAVVCVDNSNGVEFKSAVEGEPFVSPEDGVVVDCNTKIFDAKNLEFQAAGDSFVFASNRCDTWFCIARYASQWYS